MGMQKTGDNSRRIPGGKTQVNFNLSNEVLEQVKNLAFWEDATCSDIYSKSVAKFIELYEKKNGQIKPRPAGNGLDNL